MKLDINQEIGESADQVAGRDIHNARHQPITLEINLAAPEGRLPWVSIQSVRLHVVLNREGE